MNKVFLLLYIIEVPLEEDKSNSWIVDYLPPIIFVFPTRAQVQMLNRRGHQVMLIRIEISCLCDCSTTVSFNYKLTTHLFFIRDLSIN